MDLLERLEALGEIIAEAEVLAERSWEYGKRVPLPGGTKSVMVKKGAYLPLAKQKMSKGVEGYFVHSPFTGQPVFIAKKRPQVSQKHKAAAKFGLSKGGALKLNKKRSSAARGSATPGGASTGWKKRKGEEG